MIAIGIGCRRGTDVAAILHAIDTVCAALDRPADCLATAAFKDGEPGLHAAAHRLALPLRLIDHAGLAAMLDCVSIRSDRVHRHVGTASVAEAAALAAAGPDARLIVPRLALSGVTCAIALGECP